MSPVKYFISILFLNELIYLAVATTLQQIPFHWSWRILQDNQSAIFRTFTSFAVTLNDLSSQLLVTSSGYSI